VATAPKPAREIAETEAYHESEPRFALKVAKTVITFETCEVKEPTGCTVKTPRPEGRK
jgi:hypothetical protein